MAVHKSILNPAFHRYPVEAAIIGRLVVGFGELEYSLAELVGHVTNDRQISLKIIYTLHLTSARIDIAEIVLQPFYEKVAAKSDCAETFFAIRQCLRIRNTYAHCNWADDLVRGGGLFYTDLQKAVHLQINDTLPWKHIDASLLVIQENYFTYTLEMIRHLCSIAKHPAYPLWPRPPTQQPPSLHNLASQHVPPWLTEDHKAQHLAFALAEEQGRPTPTPAQIRLDAERSAKREARKKHAKRSAAGDPNQKPKENP